jgi:hypothetical protein
MGPCRGSIALTCFDLRHPKTIATLLHHRLLVFTGSRLLCQSLVCFRCVRSLRCTQMHLEDPWGILGIRWQNLCGSSCVILVSSAWEAPDSKSNQLQKTNSDSLRQPRIVAVLTVAQSWELKKSRWCLDVDMFHSPSCVAKNHAALASKTIMKTMKIRTMFKNYEDQRHEWSS